MGGCELPTKWIVTMSNNDSNDNGNMSKIFIALSGSCAKLTTFPFNACWPIFPPLFEYLNLINMV
jgi:hypothetical protein